MSDSGTNSSGASEVKNPIRTAILAMILLIISGGALFFIQERSIIGTCMDIAEVMKSEPAWCLTGMEVPAGTVIDENFLAAVDKAFSDNGGRNGVFYGLLAAMMGAVVALMCVVGLPADQIQFTGNLARENAKLRVGGAVGIMLVFAAGGGWLAWTGMPRAESVLIENKTFQTLLNSHVNLQDRNKTLVDNLANKTNDFAFSILSNGYFTRMNGAFRVNCSEGAPSDATQDSLFVRIPQTAGGLETRLPFGAFEVPLEALRNGMQTAAERDNNDENWTANFPSIAIVLAKARDVTDVDTLLRTEYTLIPGDRQNAPTSREIRVRTMIDQAKINAYCDDGTQQKLRSVGSMDVGPFDQVGG